MRPDLLFLDEPTTGLDPSSRQQTWQLVRAIVAEGTTVVLTTQYLDEADQLADRIAVVDHGRVIAEGTSAELKASVGADALEVRLTDARRRPEAARLLSAALDAPIHLAADPTVLSVRFAARDGSREAGARASRALSELTISGVAVSQFARPSASDACVHWFLDRRSRARPSDPARRLARLVRLDRGLVAAAEDGRTEPTSDQGAAASTRTVARAEQPGNESSQPWDPCLRTNLRDRLHLRPDGRPPTAIWVAADRSTSGRVSSSRPACACPSRRRHRPCSQPRT